MSARNAFVSKIGIAVAASAAILLSGCGGSSSGGDEAQVDVMPIGNDKSFMSIEKNDDGKVSAVKVFFHADVEPSTASVERVLHVKGIKSFVGYYNCVPVDVAGIPVDLTSENGDAAVEIKVDETKDCRDIKYVMFAGLYESSSKTTGAKAYKKWTKIVYNGSYSLKSDYDVIPAGEGDIILHKYEKTNLSFYLLKPESPDEPVQIRKGRVYSENGGVFFVVNGNAVSEEIFPSGKYHDINLEVFAKYGTDDNIVFEFTTSDGKEVKVKIPVKIEAQVPVNVDLPDKINVGKYETVPVHMTITDPKVDGKPVKLDKIVITSKDGAALLKPSPDADTAKQELTLNFMGKAITDLDFYVYGKYTGQDSLHVSIYTQDYGLVEKDVEVSVQLPQNIIFEPESISVKANERKNVNIAFYDKDHPDKPIRFKKIELSFKDGNALFGNGMKSQVLTDVSVDKNGFEVTVVGKYSGSDTLIVKAEMENGVVLEKSIAVQVGAPTVYSASIDQWSRLDVEKGERGEIVVNLSNQDSPDRPVYVSSVKLSSRDGRVSFPLGSSINVGRSVKSLHIPFVGEIVGTDEVRMEIITDGEPVKISAQTVIKEPGVIQLDETDISSHSVYKGKSAKLSFKVVYPDNKPIKIKKVSVASEKGNVTFSGRSSYEKTLNVAPDYFEIEYEGKYIGQDSILVEFYLENGEVVKKKYAVQVEAPVESTVTIDPVSDTKIDKGQTGRIVLDFTNPESVGKPVGIASVEMKNESGSVLFVKPDGSKVSSLTDSLNKDLSSYTVSIYGDKYGSDNLTFIITFKDGSKKIVNTGVEVSQPIAYEITIDPSAVTVPQNESQKLTVFVSDPRGSDRVPDIVKVTAYSKQSLVKIDGLPGSVELHPGKTKEFSIDVYGDVKGTDTIVLDIEFANGYQKRIEVPVTVTDKRSVTLSEGLTSSKTVYQGEQASLVLEVNYPSGKPMGVEKIEISHTGENISFPGKGDSYTINVGGDSVSFFAIDYVGDFVGSDAIVVKLYLTNGNIVEAKYDINVLSQADIKVDVEYDISQTDVQAGEEGFVVLKFSDPQSGGKPVKIKYVKAKSENGNVLVLVNGSGVQEHQFDINGDIISFKIPIIGKYFGQDKLDIVVVDGKDRVYTTSADVKTIAPVEYKVTAPASVSLPKYGQETIVYKIEDPRGGGRIPDIDSVILHSASGNVVFENDADSITLHPGQTEKVEVVINGKYKGSDNIEAVFKFKNGTEKTVQTSVEVTDALQYQIDTEGYVPSIGLGKEQKITFNVSDGTDPERPVGIETVHLEVNGPLKIKDASGQLVGTLDISNVSGNSFDVVVIGSDIGSASLTATITLKSGQKLVKKLTFEVSNSLSFGRVSIQKLAEAYGYDNEKGLFYEEFSIVVKDLNNNPIRNQKVDIGIMPHIVADTDGNLMYGKESGILDGNTFSTDSTAHTFDGVKYGDVVGIYPRYGREDSPSYLGGWTIDSKIDNESVRLTESYDGTASQLNYIVGNSELASVCDSTVYRAYIESTSNFMTDDNGEMKIRVSYPAFMVGKQGFIYANVRNDGLRIGNTFRFTMRGEGINIFVIDKDTGTSYNSEDYTVKCNGNERSQCNMTLSFKVKPFNGYLKEAKMIASEDFYIGSGCQRVDFPNFGFIDTGCDGKVDIRMEPKPGEECVVTWRRTFTYWSFSRAPLAE